ncbi:MAG: Outer membrane protein assembly factor BamA precursor [Deltaproteobacteria bacterium ADurb.Bin510]|nr:MAG: Outer membrane protein assembly factor BamA precursor [Deltaproteobacteria bacterium ADurb.Bin510]
MLSADGNRADLRFAVERGQYVSMGDTFYQGNFKTRKRTLRHALDLEQGEPFSLSRLYAAQKDLRDMGVFESVKFKTLGLKEGDERVTLIVDVEETAPYYLQGSTGYTSDRGLYAATRAGDRNLLGLAVNSWLGGEVSQIGHKFEAHLSQKRTLNTRLSTAYNYSYEKKEEFNQDFGTRVSGASLLLGCPFDELKLKSGLEVRYERREAYPVEYSARQVAANYSSRKLVVTTPSLSYDSRDSFVRPRKGWLASVSLDASRGIQSDYDDFNKYSCKLRYYTSPLAWLTLAFAGDYGHIDPLGSARQITADQLLYSGGTMSVRGYAENLLRHDAADSPVGGLQSAVVSLEARCALSPHWELSLFGDSGTVREALPESPGRECWRSSAGLGLRYVTPIGPMGLMYGYKLNPAEGDGRGRLHFSLGYTF